MIAAAALNTERMPLLVHADLESPHYFLALSPLPFLSPLIPADREIAAKSKQND